MEANHRKASSQAFCSQARQRYYAKQKSATQKVRTTRVQSHKAPQFGGLGGWPDLTYEMTLSMNGILALRSGSVMTRTGLPSRTTKACLV